MMDSVKYIDAPLSDEAVRDLRAGDVVYLSGTVYTARDGVYRHMLIEGNEPPIDLRGLTNVTFQSSPAGVETSPGSFNVASFQATAGFRYAQYMPALLEAVRSEGGGGEGRYVRGLVPRPVRPATGAVCLTTMGYGLGASIR